ncbi:MAG: type II toxin-antitoxin system VapC family toxin [Prochloraceae cyanobacterium]|nr:type II toxin-antitoxin system VapC family toxin [Prochloraceae cyanobacterium]
MSCLLDTNICIYIIKRQPPSVLQRFKTYRPGDLSISSITVAELEYGVQKTNASAKNQQALGEFLLPLNIVGFDLNCAVVYGQIRANLEKIGQSIGAMDLLIAAVAIANNLTLVTNNINEFKPISVLKLENWAD